MTSNQLRARVVLSVLFLVGALAVGLYGFIGWLLIQRNADAVPDALWLAAGTYGGALVTWLVNSKGTDTPTDVTVVNTPQDPVPVEPGDQGVIDLGLVVSIIVGVVLALLLYHCFLINH